MPLRSILYKKKLRNHSDSTSGDSVNLWSVSGYRKGAISQRIGQRIFPEFDNPAKSRNNRLKTVFQKLEQSEIILHSFFADEGPENSLSFEDMGTLMITDKRVIIWQRNSGEIDPIYEIEFSEILDVYYDPGDSKYSRYLVIKTQEDSCSFNIRYSIGVSEIEDAAGFLAKKADMAEDNQLKRKGSVESPANYPTKQSANKNPQLDSGIKSNEISTKKQSEMAESWDAHQEARGRSPPVSKGDRIKLGVLEISYHHSGEPQAVGKYEDFRIFVEDIPSSIKKGDIIQVKIMSFGRNKKSATAIFIQK